MRHLEGVPNVKACWLLKPVYKKRGKEGKHPGQFEERNQSIPQTHDLTESKGPCEIPYRATPSARSQCTFGHSS